MAGAGLMYAQALSYAALGAACAWGAWSFQGSRYERLLSEQRTEYATAQARAVEKAHAETIRLQEKADAAARKSAARSAALANDIAGARSALISMSHAADSALRRANDSHNACISAATAQGDVLNQCSARLVEVAAAADGWRNESQELRDAWPK